MRISGKCHSIIVVVLGILASLGACKSEGQRMNATLSPEPHAIAAFTSVATLHSIPLIEFQRVPLGDNVSLHNTNPGFGCGGIYAINRDIVFLFCGITGSWSTLLRSSDGGQHWTEVMDRIQGSSVIDMDFVEDGIGWALVMWTTEGPGDLTLFQTNDHGETWQNISEVPKSIWLGEPISMSFSDKTHGQIAMDYFGGAPGTDRIAYLTSFDGGLTWNENASILWNDFMPEDHNKSDFYAARLAYLNKHRRDYSQWIGQDGSLWRLDRTNAPLSSVKRRLETGEWTTMSVLPGELVYRDSQLSVP